MNAVTLREKDIALLRSILQRFSSVSEARVFGSRANGAAKRASDLDLLISAPNASSAEWSALMEALEEAPLIYELDVVRAEQPQSHRLKEKIAREGIRIYPEG